MLHFFPFYNTNFFLFPFILFHHSLSLTFSSSLCSKFFYLFHYHSPISNWVCKEQHKNIIPELYSHWLTPLLSPIFTFNTDNFQKKEKTSHWACAHRYWPLKPPPVSVPPWIILPDQKVHFPFFSCTLFKERVAYKKLPQLFSNVRLYNK